jgi:enoyl-CoA hydratase/carnithine racemase
MTADLELETVTSQRRGGVATLTLPGAPRLNPLSSAVIDALLEELWRLAGDVESRVVIIRAEGRGFCAGHDLAEMRAPRGSSDEELAFHRDLFARCSRMMQAIVELPQPVIAQVQGVAAAAGCQLVASCDLAVASQDARFATSGINVGLFCATPAVALTRAIAPKFAAEMLFTGAFIDAEEARRLGLVNRVVPAEALARETLALAEAIAAKPAEAIRAGKNLLRRQRDLGLAEAYQLAAESMACGMQAASAREGIDAFLQKRKPDWD